LLIYERNHLFTASVSHIPRVLPIAQTHDDSSRYSEEREAG